MNIIICLFIIFVYCVLGGGFVKFIVIEKEDNPDWLNNFVNNFKFPILLIILILIFWPLLFIGGLFFLLYFIWKEFFMPSIIGAVEGFKWALNKKNIQEEHNDIRQNME